MKHVVTEQWVAFDGVPFPTETECRTYERRVAHIRMVGLKIEDVEAALTRADLDLAEAFEEVARRIKRIRLGKGVAREMEDPDAVNMRPICAPMPIRRSDQFEVFSP